jgi:nitrogen fixation/metabolism regulation signal transduction histidine kinase
MEEFHRASTTVAGVIDGEQQRLQFEMGLVVLLAFILLAVAAGLISRTLARPLARLTAVARQLGQGKLDEEGLAALRQRRFSDEVTILADVFTDMGRQVVRREQKLRTEIADLHIQIDTSRRQQQVDEITDTDYFRNLRDSATRLRSRTKVQPTPEGDPV